MALAATGVWETRPDGSTNQSGFFNSARSGTDYSQQATAQLTVSDAVTTGTTTVTSATGGFTAAMAGNGIIIVGDGEYEITAVGSSTSITVDRTTGTASGQTLNVGGATTLANSNWQPIARSTLAAGQIVWVRKTTSSNVATAYTTTGALTTGTVGTSNNPVTFKGYGTVRGDGGRPTINSSYSAGAQLTVNSDTQFQNFVVQDTNGNNINGVVAVSGSRARILNCNFVCKLNASGTLCLGVTGDENEFTGCCFDANGSTEQPSVSLAGNANQYEYCTFTGSASPSDAIFIGAGKGMFFDGCTFWGNKSVTSVLRDDDPNANAQLRHCIIWNNTCDGIRMGQLGVTAWTLRDNIIGKNTLYDINDNSTNVTTNPGAIEWIADNWTCNFFLTTGTARYRNLPANPNDTSLTVDPFNNAAIGDFSLNSTAGGGALITADTCVTTFLTSSAGQTVTSTQVAGPYGVPTAPSATISMRSLWRELTNERSLTVVPDSVVDIYLDFGLQELNRRLHYHYTTASDITLVAGVQEYPMPTAAIEIVFVQYGGNRLLEKGSVEQWRRLGEDWRNETPAEPLYWAHYGSSFVIRPAPSALAVASAPNLTVRRKDTPPSITTNGPEQLPIEAYRPVVEYGAALWSAAYPDSVVAQQRAAYLKAEFEAAVNAMIESYARRELAL